MANYSIEGGQKLSGTITTNSSKNGSLALIAAALLNDGVTILHNVARIEEVNRFLEVIKSLGVTCEWIDEHDLRIDPTNGIHPETIDQKAAVRTRVVLYLLGSLVHHHTSFKIPQPGGCRLGKRTVLPHLLALQDFGIAIETTEENYEVAAKKLTPVDRLVLYESGDTVTVNAILAAARIPGVSQIRLASANYQVQDVCYFLQGLGVSIDGIGSTTLTITGKEKITVDEYHYTVTEDPIETMLFLSIAATTNSAITIKRCPIEFIELEIATLRLMGLQMTISPMYKAHNGHTDLVDITTHESTLVAPPEKIHPRPFPGLNIDNLPFFAPIATQADGQTFIFDWVFEERVIYFTELKKLGASVTLVDPHRVFIQGKTPLQAAEIMCPPALRPSTIIMVAMLAARGTSLLRNVYSIERGYENLPVRLAALGARITKVD